MSNHKISSPHFLVALGIGLFLIAGLLWLGKRVLPGIANGPSEPTDIVLADLSRNIEKYNTILKTPDLPDDFLRWVIAQKKYDEKQATQRAAYLQDLEKNPEKYAGLKKTAIVEATLTIVPTAVIAPLPTGFLQEFTTHKYKEGNFNTAWVDRNGNEEIIYFAGFLVEEPEQGILYVENKYDHTVLKLKTPEKNGALKILKLENKHVYLDSQQGPQYDFDVSQKKFIDKNGIPLPESSSIPLPETTSTPVPAYP